MSCYCKLFFLMVLFCTATLVNSKPPHGIQKRQSIPPQQQEYMGDIFPGESGEIMNNNPDDISRTNCKVLLERDYTESGMYEINPTGNAYFPVFCDMTLQGGGWTIIQRRVDGSEDFNLDWNEYRSGFGLLHANFWLGLERISQITQSEEYELYIGLQSFDDEFKKAWYTSFEVDDEASNYKLTLGPIIASQSDVYDSFMEHNGVKFSTKDKDNDGLGGFHCANAYQSGWWYSNTCHDAHLNGVYQNDPGTGAPAGHGIIWQGWKGNTESLKAVVMAIRPLDK